MWRLSLRTLRGLETSLLVSWLFLSRTLEYLLRVPGTLLRPLLALRLSLLARLLRLPLAGLLHGLLSAGLRLPLLARLSLLISTE